MTNEQKMELIQSYINDLRELDHQPHLTVNQKQHIRRALETYTNLYSEVERGRYSADELHENITSLLYVIQ